MIVLTIDEKDWLLNFLEEFKAGMLADGLAVIPIEFTGGWMLPEAVLDDPRCAKAKQKLIDIGEYQNMTIRDVLPEELFVYEAPHSTDSARSSRNNSEEQNILESSIKAGSVIQVDKLTTKQRWFARLCAVIKKAYKYVFRK